ncbi:hypothetical protein CEXT_146971 [Caerostris extrusa]|uniref:Uncharacterized protein n=1 Tax=Caerostris extrusa TaxID=172846 RepID=A0AAV4Y019_CAEEX|nr:hypothetical protein CEXT_146971 [Caerostris extrusa]
MPLRLIDVGGPICLSQPDILVVLKPHSPAEHLALLNLSNGDELQSVTIQYFTFNEFSRALNTKTSGKGGTIPFMKWDLTLAFQRSNFGVNGLRPVAMLCVIS